MSSPDPSAKVPAPAQPSSDKSTPARSFLSVKVIIGAITAAVSFFLALNQVTGVVQKFRIHHKDFVETMKIGDQQMQRGEYPAAFDNFKHAVELDPIDREAQHKQAQAGMLWLENAHSAQRSFKETADQVEPVLDRALTHAHAQEAGDLAAHIGWANFLRQREGAALDLPVESSYKQSLDFDSGNVYGHAMWGHWIMWHGGDVKSAENHFSAAVASGRVRPYVRQMQLSAFMNSTQSDDELLKTVDEMRRGAEAIDLDLRHRIFYTLFVVSVYHPEELARSVKPLPAESVEATYDWLGEGYFLGNATQLQLQREYLVAFLGEIGGKKQDALSGYRALQNELRKTQQQNTSPSFIGAVDAAIKRVS